MADVSFYSTVAQVIPVLFLAVAIDRGGFTRPATREELRQIREEERAKTDQPNMAAAARRKLEQSIADAPDLRKAAQRQLMLATALKVADERAKEAVELLYRRAVLKSTLYGTFTMLLLAVAEVAALKVTATHDPSTAARLLCEFGLLFAGATVLFSLLDPEVIKIGELRGWTLTRTQIASKIVLFCSIGLLTLIWRVL